MNNGELDQLFREARAEPLPECPIGLRDEVLRRVRRERAGAGEPDAFWAEVFRLAFRPQVAAGLLALTVALGVMTTAVASQSTPVQMRADDPLGFESISNPHLLECYHHRSDWWKRD